MNDPIAILNFNFSHFCAIAYRGVAREVRWEVSPGLISLITHNLNFEFPIKKVLIYLVNRAGIQIPDTQNLKTSVFRTLTSPIF